MRIRLSILALLIPFLGQAQFVLSDSESARVQWNYIETPTYKVIYPRGFDSTALVYARILESCVEPVGRSVGFKPNQSFASPHPVIIHPYSSISNGMVAWAPRRTELYTIPDILNPESTPWEQHLIIHESRHAAQMQFTAAKPFRWLNYLGGQILGGAVDALYFAPEFAEGDAVVTETAFTHTGRGRTADFLEYYRVSFAEGNMRNYIRWTFPSQRHFTPDHYKSGYISFAGMKSVFGIDNFPQLYTQRLANHLGIVLGNSDKVTRPLIGKSYFDAFATTCDTLRAEWQRDEELRAPFIQRDTIIGEKRYFTEYSDLAYMGSELYAVRSGLTLPTELIRLRRGKEQRITAMSSAHSSPRYSPATSRLYWHEYQGDLRWGQLSYSNLYFFDGYHKRTLLSHTRYFNPSPSKDDALLAVCELPTDGHYAICILDAFTGQLKHRIPCPDGLQPVETVWIGNQLYMSAISQSGYGIYSVADFCPVLEPSYVKIKQLSEKDDYLLFVCDRTSVNELYELNPHNGEIFQLSNTRFGLSDYCFNSQGDTLYYCSLTPRGRMITSTDHNDLLLRKVSLSDITEQPLVAGIVESEKRIAQQHGRDFELMPFNGEQQISQPRPYNKLFNTLQVHSWAPVYVDYDAIKARSFENIFSVANLGATSFFQNELNNLYGSIGISLMDNQFQYFRPSCHLSLTYTGLYPVIETKLHANTRNAAAFRLEENEETIAITGYESKVPSVSGSIKAYLPLNLSSNGIQRGIIPSLSISGSSDRYYMSETKSVPMLHTIASIRGYVMEGVTNSRVFPRLGIGAELGYAFRPNMTNLINPNTYAAIYAYIPGLYETNGLKISMIQQWTGDKAIFNETYANTLPRGFKSSILQELRGARSHNKISVDYAIPFWAIDSAWLGRLLVFRNLELIPHIDSAIYRSQHFQGSLCSGGLDLCVRMSTVLNTYKVGISLNYLGGTLYKPLYDSGLITRPLDIGFILSMDL